MRTIKFRFWDNYKKEYISNSGNPNLFPFNGKIGMTCNGSRTGCIDTDDWIQETYIIEQFTGLHDKNGNEIFEGDIVHSERFHIRQKYRVIWENRLSKYELSDTKWPDDCISMNKEFMSWFDVIGNIHENADLLDTTPNL